MNHNISYRERKREEIMLKQFYIVEVNSFILSKKGIVKVTSGIGRSFTLWTVKVNDRHFLEGSVSVKCRPRRLLMN